MLSTQFTFAEHLIALLLAAAGTVIIYYALERYRSYSLLGRANDAFREDISPESVMLASGIQQLPAKLQAELITDAKHTVALPTHPDRDLGLIFGSDENDYVWTIQRDSECDNPKLIIHSLA